MSTSHMGGSSQGSASSAGDTGEPHRSLLGFWRPRYWPAWCFVAWLRLSAALPLGWNLRASGTADYRHRADGQKYTLVGMKGSYTIRRTEIFVDGTNLLNETYREVAGVSMPGRWVMVGLSIN